MSAPTPVDPAPIWPGRVNTPAIALLRQVADGARLVRRSLRGTSTTPDYQLGDGKTIPEATVRQLTERGLLAGRPVDPFWNEILFVATDKGMALLAKLAAEAPPPVRRERALEKIPPGSKTSPCRLCGKPIYWIEKPLTAGGTRRVPVSVNPGRDARCAVPTPTTWGEGIAHFADCEVWLREHGGPRA